MLFSNAEVAKVVVCGPLVVREEISLVPRKMWNVLKFDITHSVLEYLRPFVKKLSTRLLRHAEGHNTEPTIRLAGRSKKCPTESKNENRTTKFPPKTVRTQTTIQKVTDPKRKSADSKIRCIETRNVSSIHS
ncbi:hypothetical protein TNCV_3604081 [Trichonephila clavipes]|nr:hypothetical protein TNCV_3604081 [Trichonephila clavipes]